RGPDWVRATSAGSPWRRLPVGETAFCPSTRVPCFSLSATGAIRAPSSWHPGAMTLKPWSCCSNCSAKGICSPSKTARTRMTMPEPLVQVVEWSRTPALRGIRQCVFVDEQQVPAELEWDAHDSDATHFLLTVEGRSLGTARLLADGHIGRVALRAEARGQGLGALLMRAVMAQARSMGLPRLELSAQTEAVGVYQRPGFSVCSEEYLDAGIPHRDMCLPWPAP